MYIFGQLNDQTSSSAPLYTATCITVKETFVLLIISWPNTEECSTMRNSDSCGIPRFPGKTQKRSRIFRESVHSKFPVSQEKPRSVPEYSGNRCHSKFPGSQEKHRNVPEYSGNRWKWTDRDPDPALGLPAVGTEELVYSSG